jgi:protein disulfide-isomerase A1
MIALFKDFDEGKVFYDGTPDVAQLSHFVDINSVPLVIDFSYDFAPLIFSGSVKNHVLLFASTKADNYNQIKGTLTKLATIYKGKLMFIVVDSDNEELKTVSQFAGVTEAEVPTLRIVSLGDEMQKFKNADPKLEEESIKLFIEQFLAGELKPDLLSEDVPEDWDHKPVKVLVGKNFNQVVNSDKKTLVMFYAPWCGHCKKLEPLWEQLAEKYEDSKDVIIAKMDSTKNELEHSKVKAFPTVKLFMKGELKSNAKSKDYNGERTVDGIVKFIESDGMDGGAVDVDDDSYDEETGHDEL